jgi:RTX calcium-binding nonapeptide repeat (4 copies)
VGRRSHRSGTGYSVYLQTGKLVRKEGNEMRTLTILIALMSVMLVVFAGVALAKVINGDDNDNHLRGTNRADTISGKGGDDFINGRDGNDKLFPGSGEDIVGGGNGTDVINAVDESQDVIGCGGGRDRLRMNPGDMLWGPQHFCQDAKIIREGIKVQGPFKPCPQSYCNKNVAVLSKH